MDDSEDFVARAAATLARALGPVDGVVVRGSRAGEAAVDAWSDTDLLVVLAAGARPDPGALRRAVADLGTVVGGEITGDGDPILCRAAIVVRGGAVELVDASVCSHERWRLCEASAAPSRVVLGGIRPADVLPRTVPPAALEAYAARVDGVWWSLALSIKKFARQDNLIGLHLLLDVLREYLVVEMIARDARHGTSVHRFGENEALPEELRLGRLDPSERSALVAYIDALARAYDGALAAGIPGYRGRHAAIASLLDRLASAPATDSRNR